MIGLAVLVVSIGLADSVNPSTVGPALYLATRANGRRDVLRFTAGVFIVCLLGGLILTVGPGQLILATVPRPGQRVTHLIELAAGAVAAMIGFVTWAGHRRVAQHLARQEQRVARSSLWLGAGIMAVELPTAFPYFAVIAATVGSGRSVAAQVILLLLFNATFVAPLLGIVAIRSLAGRNADRFLARLRVGLDRRAPVLIPAFVMLIAIVFLSIGAVGLSRD